MPGIALSLVLRQEVNFDSLFETAELKLYLKFFETNDIVAGCNSLVGSDVAWESRGTAIILASGTFFREDSGFENTLYFYGHSSSSTDSRRPVVS